MTHNSTRAGYRIPAPATPDFSQARGQLFNIIRQPKCTDFCRSAIQHRSSQNPELKIKKTFTLVLKGHISLASAQFPEGIGGQHLDTLARQFLWHHGYDFNHGTGHGVGSYLNVHEGPHAISKNNTINFQEGMIVSNEPGYYEKNKFFYEIRKSTELFISNIDIVFR